MKTLIFSLLMVTSLTSHAGDFRDYYNNASQVVALLSLYGDWHTTREAGKYYETPNPRTGKLYKETEMLGLFGKYPSPGEINSYFATWVIINLSVNYWGNDTVKTLFNTCQFSVHYKSYNNNVSIGLSRAF
jgi:hypothetical protein